MLNSCGTRAGYRHLVQYLHHAVWRAERDELKFDRVKGAGTRVAKARDRIIADLRAQGPARPRRRDRHEAARPRLRPHRQRRPHRRRRFLRPDHPRAPARPSAGRRPRLQLVGKSRNEHAITISDPHVIESLDLMRRRRGGSTRLLAYRGQARWADLDATAVNAYISEMVAADLTAEDFRTWHATVLAAVALAGSPERGDTKASQKWAVKAAVEEVLAYLGSSPTISKKSYIDPRVIDQYEAGVTIAGTFSTRYRDDTARQAAIEKAVARLIDGAD